MTRRPRRRSPARPRRACTQRAAPRGKARRTVRQDSPAAKARRTIRVGVSACLLGQNVRYDGGHKRDDFVAGELARRVVLVPVCPEVELGLGTPREPIRLERKGGALRLVAPGSGEDHTLAMCRYAEERVSELERLGLSGYVFKEGSPSCGVERVPAWRGEARTRAGRGLFAAALMARLPNLPVVEESDLRDEGAREAFLERVSAYCRLRSLGRGRRRAGR